MMPARTVKKRKPSQRAAKNRATALHSQLVRRLGYCQKCQRRDTLQCAHIIGRSYAHTRTDTANAFCLCAGCHMRFTYHPDEWMAFCDRMIGRDEYDRLKRKALDGVNAKFDWVAEEARLKALVPEEGF